MANKEIGARLSEQQQSHVPADATYNAQNKARFDKIKKEPLIGVYGNPLYVQYLGDAYSFDYQDYPVTIVFDGKTHYYHKTIAELVQKKLDAAARAHVPKIAGDGDKLN